MHQFVRLREPPNQVEFASVLTESRDTVVEISPYIPHLLLQTGKAVQEHGEASGAAVNGFHSYRCRQSFHHTLLGGKKGGKGLPVSRHGQEYRGETRWDFSGVCKERGMHVEHTGRFFRFMPDLFPLDLLHLRTRASQPAALSR